MSRIEKLASQFQDADFRRSYWVTQLKVFLAAQIRALRGDMSQAEFGKLIDKPQSVVSRLEKQSYGKVNLQTLIDIANKLDIALVVRFVSFPTFLRSTEDFSEAAILPEPYQPTQMTALVAPQPTRNDAVQAAINATRLQQRQVSTANTAAAQSIGWLSTSTGTPPPSSKRAFASEPHWAVPQ